jgi:environmental stress-induced protein Ves
MSLKIIRKTEQITSHWSGGTTTQLYIYPENASYQKRNFLFRISTATVESNESTFTSLPGVSRLLMILEGSLKIIHTGRYSKILQKFETDSFEGDWETKGFGKVTDFNLMTTGKLQGTIHGTSLKKDETIQFHSNLHKQYIGLYILKGSLEVLFGRSAQIGNKGDFILSMTLGNLMQVVVNAMEASEIAVSKITFPDFN